MLSIVGQVQQYYVTQNKLAMYTANICKGHFHVAMVILAASAQRFPIVAVLLKSSTTDSWKQNVNPRPLILGSRM